MANRRQHTIPQFYLRPFLSDGWVYRRGKSAPRATKSAANIAVQQNYYGKDAAGRKTLDYVNTEIDNKSASSFNRLINNPTQLTPADWVSLSFLFANLFVRNKPLIEEWSAAIVAAASKADDIAWQTRWRHEALLLIGDPSKFRPELYNEAPTVTHHELMKHAAMLRSKGGHRIAADDIFGALPDIAERIQQMALLILEAPEHLS